ncbi:hypothetical protein RBB50_010864 [Rhinocladiella similis]
MARRKRTPSDPSSSAASQKRVAFEVPASLQQLSTISRSLATSTESSRPAASQVHSQPPLSQPRPTSSESSSIAPAPLPAASRPIPRKPVQFVASKRPFPDAQPWPQPMQRPQPNNTAATYPARPTDQPHTPSFEPSSEVTPAAVVMANPQPNASNPSSNTFPVQEPALKPGETPSLTTHPNLIASLVAQRRAENEAMGFRERWAKRQAEYQMSKSASSPLQNGPKAAENVARHTSPKTVSKSPPVRSASALSRTSAPATAALDADAAAADKVSIPATGDPGRERGVHERLPTESDSLFDSPFPSPAADFRTKPTHNVDLKGICKSTTASNKPSVTNTPILQSREHQRPLPPAPAPPQANASVEHVSIPSLFSDKNFRNQSHSQPQNHLGQVGQISPYNNSPEVTQQHAYPRVSMSRQDSQSQLKAYGSQPQMSPQPPVMVPNTYYARSPSISGYYKMDLQGQFYNSEPSPTTQSGTNNFDATGVYGRSSTPMNMTYPSHLGQNPNTYMVTMAPTASPLSTYGASLATTTEQTKQQPPNTSMVMTATDMVAGINTKFKVSTKDRFFVPKRF